MSDCCLRWPLCGADVTGHCPTAQAVQGLLDAHPVDCPCLACARAFGVVPARAWTVTVTAPGPSIDAAPTVRPPADQRCERCDRVLIATPCPCVTPVERAIASGRAHRADMARLTPAERIAAWRALKEDAVEARPCSFDINTTHEGTSP
jgi:hypothetical protein